MSEESTPLSTETPDPGGRSAVAVLVREIGQRFGLDQPGPGDLTAWLERAAQVPGAGELVDACRWLLGRGLAGEPAPPDDFEAERVLRAEVATAVSALTAVGDTPLSARIAAVLTAMGRLVRADRACVVLWADQDDEQSWGVLGGEAVLVPGALREPALREIFPADGAIVFADARTDPGTPLRELAARLGSASLVLVPAWLSGTCAGMVSFERLDAASGWARIDAALLIALARAIFQVLASRRASRRLQLLSLIADNVRDIVFVRHGVTGELLYVNHAFERLTGVPPSAIRKDFDRWLELFEPEDKERFLRDASSRLMEGWTFQVRMKTVGGAMRWMSSRVFPVLDRDPPVLVGIVEDISDRKAQEQTMEAQIAASTSELVGAHLHAQQAVTGRERALRDLASSELRFQALMEALPATVLIVRGAQIVYASAAAGQPIGCRSDVLVGRDLSAVFGGFGVSVDELLAQARQPVQDGPVRQILSFGMEGAATARLDVSIVRLDASPDPSLLVVGFDVTVRDQAAASARESLDRIGGDTRDQAMIELSAALAHEINQPLTALAFFLEAVSANLAAPLPDVDPQEGLALAAEQARRAGEIVKRLRARFSRPMPARIHAPVGDLIASVCALYRDPAERSRIRLRAKVEPADLTVFADPQQLKLTLAHLVRNAIRAFDTQVEGEREVEVGARRAEEGVEIWVKDNAPPLDREVRDRVFSSFRGTRASGVGVGLYLVRQIVEAHGGTLSLKEAADHKVFSALYPQGSG